MLILAIGITVSISLSSLAATKATYYQKTSMCEGRQKSNTQTAKHFTIYSYDTGFQESASSSQNSSSHQDLNPEWQFKSSTLIQN